MTAWCPPACRERGGPRAAKGQGGFSVLESTIALGLLFMLATGLLATVGPSVRAVVTARQRGLAVALANEVMEQARGLSYDSVGHDLAALPAQLASTPDPELTAVGASWYWSGAPGEPLAGAADPRAPFVPHQWSRVTQGVTYRVAAYVTGVTPPATTGDPYKRVSVVVRWDKGQYAPALIVPEVRLSSFLFAAEQPPDPLLLGNSDTDAGRVKVTGYLQNLDLDVATFWFPSTHGEIDSQFIRRSSGYAGTSRSELDLNVAVAASEIGGCALGSNNKFASCPGVKAETVADNDSGTAPADHDARGPVFGAAGTVERSNGSFAIAFGGTNDATSASTALSCLTCFPTAIGDDDGLPYHTGASRGPGSLSMRFDVAGTTGDVVAFTGNAEASSLVDRDDAGVDHRICATSGTSHPAVDVLPLVDSASNILGTPLPTYAGLVRIGASVATASACAGPGAAVPSAAGPAVTVQLFELTGLGLLPGYRSVTVTPGVALSDSTSVQLLVAGNTVTLTANVEARPASVASAGAGATVTHAEAGLTNWLQVTARLLVQRADASVVADVSVDLDYGRVWASADYQPGA